MKMHHTALRPTPENYQRTVDFYVKLLGCTIQREWTSKMGPVEMKCSMIDIGDGTLIEIFGNGASDELTIGSIPHVSYEVEDVEAMMLKAKEAGYPPVSPRGTPVDGLFSDIVMCEEPRYTLRVAFIKGPCGELIEFIKELD